MSGHTTPVVDYFLTTARPVVFYSLHNTQVGGLLISITLHGVFLSFFCTLSFLQVDARDDFVGL